jgi:hypothetical protein
MSSARSQAAPTGIFIETSQFANIKALADAMKASDDQGRHRQPVPPFPFAHTALRQKR